MDEGATQAGDSPRTTKTALAPVPAREVSEKDKARAALLDLRCLNLCIGMLERVNGVRFFVTSYKSFFFVSKW